MGDCIFVPNGTKFICEKCGSIAPFQDVQQNCKIEVEPFVPDLSTLKEPSFLEKAKNFSSAFIKDISTGMKRCTEEEIQERLEICRDCPLFKKYSDEPIRGVCTHKSCGCNIKDTQEYWNKLAWKSQECPLKKW